MHQGAEPHAPSRWRPWPKKGKGRWLSCRPARCPLTRCFCTCGYQAAQRPSLSSRRAVGKASTQGPHPNSGCVSCLRGWGARRLFSHLLARQPEPQRRSAQALGQVGRVHIPALQMRKLRAREGAVHYLPKVIQLAGLDQPVVCWKAGKTLLL